LGRSATTGPRRPTREPQSAMSGGPSTAIGLQSPASGAPPTTSGPRPATAGAGRATIGPQPAAPELLSRLQDRQGAGDAARPRRIPICLLVAL
jgi:hypothetical protein